MFIVAYLHFLHPFSVQHYSIAIMFDLDLRWLKSQHEMKINFIFLWTVHMCMFNKTYKNKIFNQNVITGTPRFTGVLKMLIKFISISDIGRYHHWIQYEKHLWYDTDQFRLIFSDFVCLQIFKSSLLLQPLSHLS